MMPFDITDKRSLPPEYHQYWPIISARCTNLESRICYLTIHESMVWKGETQRRCGIHSESPGVVVMKGTATQTEEYVGMWGGGSRTITEVRGGIYMASNVAYSCRIYPYKINNHHQMVGDGGDMDFLKEFFPQKELLEANELLWLTDTTPHEALPVTRDIYRQFFRVVGQISHWYEQHSTPNRLGIKDPSVIIIKENKFDNISRLPSTTSCTTSSTSSSTSSSFSTTSTTTSTTTTSTTSFFCDSLS